MLSAGAPVQTFADDAARYIREAEYYQKKADSYRREAAYYLKRRRVISAKQPTIRKREH